MRRLDPVLAVGLACAAILAFIAFYGERIAPFEPIYLVGSPKPPDGTFRLGTDNSGRDLVSLVLFGAKSTLLIVSVAGISRTAIGVLLAFASRARPLGAALDAAAEVGGSLPATIAALLVVLAVSSREPDGLVFVVALSVLGWTGPYRLVRSELRRLSATPFTEGARALGIPALEILRRHHLPHLVPVLALSAAQQVAASLVALAELAVLGAFVGLVRAVDLSESLRVVRPYDVWTLVLDTPEWEACLP